MRKLHFEIMIRAKPEAVWQAIIGEQSFREWTKPFNEQSHFVGGWNQGDAIRFIGLNEKGEEEGMVSEIAESRPYEHLSIRHLGYIMGGKVDTESEAVKKWAPAYENYTLTPMGEETKFAVDMDAEEEWLEMFKDMWPKSLDKLKEIAER